MKNSILKGLVLSLAILFSLTLSVQAAEDKPDSLADVWVMIPNPGQEAQFETAFKKHIQFRTEKNDAREWKVYRPTIGTRMDRYIVRYCCTKWNDVDAYQKWQSDNKILEHWYANVDQYVARYEHFYTRIDFANSHWPEEEGYRYFAVTDYRVKMGQWKDVEAMKKILSDSAIAMKWPYSWVWGQRIGGKGGLSLVIPYRNYAEMTPPDSSFAQALAKHMSNEDKAEELLEDWSENFKSTTYTVYRLVDEMSMKTK
ncbi:hypothetical protein [uncultured Shewanella sp.]|uniref:hypothetical protein n=1 Tax=uncultured Shewanella sp. TaxID=173975 RepID=UPI00261855E1|nr:hypothetical protein [uncultured Shewanella sp.]